MTTEVLSPTPVSNHPNEDESVIVVESSDDEEPTIKRRRTSAERESVVDLTEDDDSHKEDHIRFRILPKLMRLPPFQFSENDEETDAVPLATLRDHLRQIFSVFPVGNEPPSPINPDELEITGVKESNSSSLSSSSSSTTTTTTTSCTSNSHNHNNKPRTNNKPIKPTTIISDNKENEKEKEKEGKVSLECAICLGDMKNITATTCGHIFCKECIQTAIQVTKCCPLCKKKLTSRSIHPIYL